MGCTNNLQESATPEEAVVFVVQNHRDRSQAVGQTRLSKRLQQGLQADSDLSKQKAHPQ